MADYLCPEADIALTDKKKLFSITYRTNCLGTDGRIVKNCETMCGEVLNNSYIFVMYNPKPHQKMTKVMTKY